MFSTLFYVKKKTFEVVVGDDSHRFGQLSSQKRLVLPQSITPIGPNNNNKCHFSRKNSNSLSSAASRTERMAQFLDFSVVLYVCPSKNARNLRKI
jgi:hypothetical protein